MLMVDLNGEVYLIGVIYSGCGMVFYFFVSVWGLFIFVNIEMIQFLLIYIYYYDFVFGDVLRDGIEFFIKFKFNIFYWKIENGDVLMFFIKFFVEVFYYFIGFGEVICWSVDGQSYYILFEGYYFVFYVYFRFGGGYGLFSVIGK